MAMKNCGNIQKYIKIIIPFKLLKYTVLRWKPSCKDFMFLPVFYFHPFHNLYFFLLHSLLLSYKRGVCVLPSRFSLVDTRDLGSTLTYCYNFYSSVIIYFSYSILFNSQFKFKNTTSQIPPLLTKIFWNMTEFVCLCTPYFRQLMWSAS